jgi:transcriptional regulator with XRE-family HTH domain
MTEMPETGAVPTWTLGWRMQRSLAHAGLSSQEMSADLGVSRTTISRWLNDRGTPPRAAYVKQWALHTGVPYEWLSEGSPAPSRRGAGRLASTCTRDQFAAAA